MKKFYCLKRITLPVVLIVVLLLAVTSFTSCKNDPPAPCAVHADENTDGLCDVCGETVEHTPPCTTHTDGNCDAKCDSCGAAVAVLHTDSTGDGKCDKCATCLEHRDNDCNNGCDNCNQRVEIGHSEKNGDGNCDKCGACVAHIDNDCGGVCDKCATPVLVMHKDDNTGDFCDKCGERILPISFSATKTASVAQGVTLYPTHYIAWKDSSLRGARVTYTITVTNTGENEATVMINDTVPARTRFVSGCENKVDDKLSWTVRVPVGEERSISYTVEVSADETWTNGGYIEGEGAMVNDMSVDCYDLYIEKTLNEVDIKYLEKAIKILSKSTYTDFVFAKWAYGMAYTNPKTITGLFVGTPAEVLDAIFAADVKLVDTVVPGLYGGTAATDVAGIKGVRGRKVTAADLMSGDLLLVRESGETRLYIVCEDTLYDITATAVKTDMATMLASLATAEKYVVVRPSVAMTNFTPSDPNETPEVINAYQEALVKTADTFFLRGENLQYEDVWYGLITQSGEHRWTHGQKAPEEYTADEWGYVNCAVFTYDVYLNALGYALPNNMYTTANLAANAETLGMQAFYFENTTPGSYTEEQMLEVERQFMAALQVGDLMVVRRSNNNGHVMLYIGNGKFIHSSGSSYTKTDAGVGYEQYEPTIRYHKVSDYFFNPTAVGGNPFRGEDEYASYYVEKLLIVRPLNAFNDAIPTNTVNRVQNMQGIRAEKLSSHPSSVSVNPGDLVTFTFSLFNVNAEAKTVEIYDKVPAGTSYVSGGERVEGDELYWTVSVGAGETVTVSYTVRVGNVADGTLIDGNDATVGGVKHRCAAIRVKNTLTASEQAAIKAAVEELKNEGTTLTKLALVNEIYKRALGVENIFATTDVNSVMRDGSESIFATSTKKYSNKALSCLRTDETYYSRMLVDHLYGGMRFDSSAKLYDRTKLLKTHNLVVGDVLIARTAAAERVYIYVGDGELLLLDSGVGDPADFQKLSENIMYFGRDFAVVRPSYVIEES